jgi:hypothetical protein
MPLHARCRRISAIVATLEQVTVGSRVRAVLPDGLVNVIDVRWHGSSMIEVTYKETTGRLRSELLYRDREPTIKVASTGRPWSFDGDGHRFRAGIGGPSPPLGAPVRLSAGHPYVCGRYLARPGHRAMGVLMPAALRQGR